MSGLNRLQLANALIGLPTAEFDKVLFALKPPSGLVPGPTAPQASRVMALLEWAESPTGRGIQEIQPLLESLDTLPPPPDLDPTHPTSLDLGPNPYQGLRAFEEEDQDRFFGRDQLITELCDRFEKLHADPHTVRVLPIYGPSGSGKSSLAKAGLIPALRQSPLPGKDSPKIITLKPGNHPLEVLAAALARLSTSEEFPMAQIRAFQDELWRSNSKQAFDGLRFITDRWLENDPKAYLIILVDQFEEIYTLCEDSQERDALICNLRGAASNPTQRVSILLTMRSDFLGATQQHPQFNNLFSYPGKLIPVMQPDELEQAITQPAKQALAKLDRKTRDQVNHWVNKSFVQLLVKDTLGQEGALPLLQFLLIQIWEDMRQGIEPIETLNRVGGVGGALANEAREIYEDLSEAEQKIARSIFLRLIKVNDDKTATRRRVPLAELVTQDSQSTQVKEVIDRFTRPGVWILVAFANEEQIEMVEVAHEALIHHWAELREWLADQWELLRKRDKIEQATQEWESHQKDNEYLLQGRFLRDASEFHHSYHDNSEMPISKLATEFIQISQRKKRNSIVKQVSILMIFPLIGTVFIANIFLFNHAQKAIAQEDPNCIQDRMMSLWVRYLIFMGQKENLERSDFCGDVLNEMNLSEANLWRTNFKYAHLADANLSNTQIREANFQGANLMRTDFSNAELENANFEGAFLYQTNLESALDIQEAQFQNALICETLFPAEFNLDPNRDCKDINL